MNCSNTAIYLPSIKSKIFNRENIKRLLISVIIISLLCIIPVSADFTSQYPPVQNVTYVKSNSSHSADYSPWMATDPALSVTGSAFDNAWLTLEGGGNITNQRFHIDLGSSKIITQIYYENYHSSGSDNIRGSKNFTIWGSNDASAFANLSYNNNTGWTQLSINISQFAQHPASDTADPHYASLYNNTIPYRYYALKIDDGWGTISAIGLRRIELQSINISCGDSAYSNWSASRDSWIKNNDVCTVRMWNSTGSHNFNFSIYASEIDYLVIGGGGAGGGYFGAGGGAGGFRNGTHTVDIINYSIIVGTGGSGTVGTNGTNSSLGITINATGGGVGAIGGGDSSTPHAGAGGSGGGGGSTNAHLSGDIGNLGGYSPVEGYAGGNSPGQAGNYPSAGGGGAGGAGQSPATTGSAGGNGGIGLQSNITGTLTYYAGGGGGAAVGTGGTGGSGGGGNGGTFNGGGGWVSASMNGTDGLGGGAGGGWVRTPPGYTKGGDGVVIVRYEGIPSSTPPTASFTMSNSTGTTPLLVNFTDTSTGDPTPTSWNWSFGDGTYSNSQNPNKLYTTFGNYTVILNASNSGGSNSTIKYIGVYNFSDYTVVTYTSNGTFIVPANVKFIEYMAVAGGGAGGGTSIGNAAGGGAGGLLQGNGFCVTASQILNIVIGSGGVNVIGGKGGNGTNSTITNTSYEDIIAVGGGGGGMYSAGNTLQEGFSGGSGGGAGQTNGAAARSGGSNVSGQGWAGGNADTTQYAGSGGGGAGETGFVGTSTNKAVGGKGGNGTRSNITGTLTYYAGGGSGSTHGSMSTNPGGGLGGGGTGHYSSNAATSGTNGLGGGGGGGGEGYNGANGGSGIIIIRYLGSGSSAPVANFTMSNSTGTSPLVVNFTDTSTNSPTSWNWTFGGANFSSGQNPTYTFTGIGNYSVILNASNSAGFNSITKYVNVTSTPSTINCGNSSFGEWSASGNSWIKNNGVCTVRMWNTTGTTYYYNLSALNVTSVEYIVVAGGGGGGTQAGGGGGGGGVLNGTITSLGNYSIIIGSGGGGAESPTSTGGSGGNSNFSFIQAIGGGGGGSASNTNGVSGGSGGGARSNTPAATWGSGTTGQGYHGGMSPTSTDGAGGGGGSFEAGYNGTHTVNYIGGNGGAGIQSSITGTNKAYGAGGGGGSNVANGGGFGGNSTPASTGGISYPGTINAGGKAEAGYGGGGGGGGDNYYGGSGANGTVIIKYEGTTLIAPVANFTMSNSTGTSPLLVNFTDTSTNAPTSWNWTFGGSNFSSGQNPTYTFTGAGNYSVILNASNSAGFNVSPPHYVNVSASTIAPVSNFSMNQSTGTSPLSVNFTDTSTGIPTSWNWTFGGANFSNGRNPTYTFTGIGNYSVTLNASNSIGYNIKTKYVEVVSALTPVANFTTNTSSGYSRLAVNFTDTSTNTPTAWNWTFGGANFSSSQNPTYTFVGAGNYSVILNASNSAGFNSITKYVDVTYRSLYCSLPSESSVYTNNTITCIWNGASGPLLMQRDYPDGTTQNAYGISPSYYGAGVYNFTIIYPGRGGFLPGSSGSTNGIFITPLTSYTPIYHYHWAGYTDPNSPVANFTMNNSAGYTPLAVNFTDTSIVTTPIDEFGRIITWNWTFGGANFSSSQNPTYTFNGSGNYSVTLQVTNESGISYITKYVNVSSPSSTSQNCGDSAYTNWVASSNNSWVKNNSVCTVRMWNSSGISYWAFNNITNIEYLVVAGGGAGGSDGAGNAGGGGAGGLLNGSISVLNGSLINVTVGSGGSYVDNQWGNNGNNSTLSNATYSISSSGGGGGGTYVGSYRPGRTGGSGGGESQWSGVIYGGGANVSGQGFAGAATTGSSTGGAGGGGAGEEGYITNPANIGGKGGNGTQNNITGTLTWYAGGGSGGTHSSGSSNPGGGLGGGGTGHYSSNAATSGTNGLGGGGGGGGESTDGGSGGSGTIIFKYLTPLTETPTITAGFTMSNSTGTTPLLVNFTDTSTGDPTSWSWTFGGANFSSGQNPTYTFVGAGNYSVVLNASNSAGFNISPPQYVNVSSPIVPLEPVASFVVDVYNATPPITLQFNSTSSNNPTSYNWSFTDVTGNNTEVWFGITQNISKVFGGTGNFSIRLNASNSAGFNISTQNTWVNISEITPSIVLPIPNFTANVTSGLQNLPVQFTDSSITSITTWNWSFGDGNTSTLQNPLFVYSVPGTYSVNLNVTNASGFNETTYPNYIIVSGRVLPTPFFTSNVTSGIGSLPVQFTDGSLTSITNWEWTFGDGNTSTLQNPLFVYNVPGTYSVKLNVTNASGFNETTRFSYITLTSSIAPIPNFTSNITHGAVPFPVQFTDDSITDITAWNWSFGDGSYSGVQNPVHVFTTLGSYTIVLTVQNVSGVNATTKIDYISADYIHAAYSADPNKILQTPADVSFTDISSGPGIDSWLWNFGDGITSTSQNPIHSYANSGLYTISLTVSSSSTGLTDSTTCVQCMNVQNVTAVSGGVPVYNFTYTGSPDIVNSSGLSEWMYYMMVSNKTGPWQFPIIGFASGIMQPFVKGFEGVVGSGNGNIIYLILWGLFVLMVWRQSGKVTIPALIGCITAGAWSLLFPESAQPWVLILLAGALASQLFTFFAKE